jgi:hypothetical protein
MNSRLNGSLHGCIAVAAHDRRIYDFPTRQLPNANFALQSGLCAGWRYPIATHSLLQRKQVGRHLIGIHRRDSIRFCLQLGFAQRGRLCNPQSLILVTLTLNIGLPLGFRLP